MRSLWEACGENHRPGEVETVAPTGSGVAFFPRASVRSELQGCGIRSRGDEDAGGGSLEADGERLSVSL